MYSTILNH